MGLFNKNSIGIDISDKTIEVVKLELGGRQIKVVSMGREYLPPGIVEMGEIKNPELLAQFFEKTLANATPLPIKVEVATFGLSESLYYIHHAFIPSSHDEDEIDVYIRKEIENNIPIPSENQLVAYKRISESTEGSKDEYLIFACDSHKVESWRRFFESQGVTINGFDPETLATRRAIIQAKVDRPYAVIDIGSNVTTISMFTKHGLRHSFFLPFAGETITAEIVSSMGVTSAEASELKMSVDLGSDDVKITHAVIKTLEQIAKEIIYTIQFFNKKFSTKIEELVLVGGTSRIKGIDKYFTSNIGVPAVLGQSLFSDNNLPLEYLESSGLALRKLVNTWDKSDPLIEEIEQRTYLDYFSSRRAYKFFGGEEIIEKEIPQSVVEVENQELEPQKPNPVVKLIKKDPVKTPKSWNLIKALALLVFLVILIVLVLLAFTSFNLSYNKSVVRTNAKSTAVNY